MKNIPLLLLLFLFACNNPAPEKTAVHDSIVSPQKTVQPVYKPGLGELMSAVQMHHAKLWFAGVNENWKLSQFEIDEIREVFETAKEIETDRPEIEKLPMIYPMLDSLEAAVKNKDLAAFKSGFSSLTNTCNNCHHATNFEFNVITIPTQPPVPNQDFRSHE